jgi:hypothetical protein
LASRANGLLGHEISASSGEGIEEVFRVITRKLVEQHQKKSEQAQASDNALTPANDGGNMGYPDEGGSGPSSFRVGIGDKRRSWLGFPTPIINIGEEQQTGTAKLRKNQRGRCC